MKQKICDCEKGRIRMKMKRYLALALALILSLSLTACGSSDEETGASVQSVAMLMGVDLTGNSQYGGVVEAKATVKVAKDASKTVGECYVEVGDQVREGDPLFAYDTDALELTVSSAELEVEQLQNSIASYGNQISELEKEKKKASSSDKLSYTLQIQEAQLSKAEAEYNLKQKQAEVERLKASMDETEVKAPVSGIVQAVGGSDSGDNYGYGNGGDSGSDNTYITLMETGTYRIKGTVSEEAARSIFEGMTVTAYARTDSTQSWSGVIESVNTSTAEQDNQNSNYYSESGGESSAKYAFYVTLDSSDGLLIGQHVYLKVGEDAGQAESEGIRLPSGYLMLDGDNASVWAEGSNGKLEKRAVTLGEYNEETDAYEITDGLALEDYIAYPDESLKEGMNTVEYDESAFSSEGGEYEEGSYEEGAYEEGPYEEGAHEEGSDEGYEGGVDTEGASEGGMIGGADSAETVPAEEG